MTARRATSDGAVRAPAPKAAPSASAARSEPWPDAGSPKGRVQLLNEAMATASSPLSGLLRSEAESFHHADLAPTRLHDNAVAQRATEALGAQAMTVGAHVFLVPQAAGRKDVIGHELGHVNENLSGVRTTGKDNGAGLAVTDPVVVRYGLGRGAGRTRVTGEADAAPGPGHTLTVAVGSADVRGELLRTARE